MFSADFVFADELPPFILLSSGAYLDVLWL